MPIKLQAGLSFGPASAKGVAMPIDKLLELPLNYDSPRQGVLRFTYLGQVEYFSIFEKMGIFEDIARRQMHKRLTEQWSERAQLGQHDQGQESVQRSPADNFYEMRGRLLQEDA